MRMKSSLDRKRVLKDPKFAKTRMMAGLFGRAASMAAGIYRLMNAADKKRLSYRMLTGKAFQWLKAGMAVDDVLFLLRMEAGLEKQVASCLPVDLFIGLLCCYKFEKRMPAVVFETG